MDASLEVAFAPLRSDKSFADAWMLLPTVAAAVSGFLIISSSEAIPEEAGLTDKVPLVAATGAAGGCACVGATGFFRSDNNAEVLPSTVAGEASPVADLAAEMDAVNAEDALLAPEVRDDDDS